MNQHIIDSINNAFDKIKQDQDQDVLRNSISLMQSQSLDSQQYS